jgi:hypothetical protein
MSRPQNFLNKVIFKPTYVKSIINLSDWDTVSESCAGRSAFGEKNEETSTHGINFSNTFDRGTTPGWLEFFKDGIINVKSPSLRFLKICWVYT